MKKISVPRNILLGTLSWFVPLGITFLITPIVVRGLGHEQFGLYALVQSFVSYSFTFNTGRALTQYISTYRASGQTERIGQAISATLMVNLLVGGISASLLALCSHVLVVSVLKIPVPLQRQALLAFYLASVTLLPLMLSYVYNAVPQALQRFDIYSIVMLGGSAFNTISNGVLVWLGYGVFAMLLWNLIGISLVCVVFAIYSRILLPEARVTFRVPGQLLWGIVKFSAGVTAYQILANVLLLFERGWIARTLGTEAVTYYVVPMTIAIYIHAFVGSLTLIIFPLASEAKAQQNLDLLRLIYTRAIKYMGLLVMFICVTLCVCGHQLLAIWMNTDIADHSSRVLAIQAIVFSAIALGIVPWQLADGLGRPSFNAWLVVGWLVIAIPLMIWLTPILGIEGTALGRLASALAIPIHALLIERWAMGKNLWGFWRRTGGSLLLAGAAAGIVEFFALRIGLHGWAGLAFAVIPGGLTYLGGLHLIRFISDDERVWLRGFVLRAVAPNAVSG